MNTYPKRGQQYTLLQIMKDLYLRDSPHLCIDVEGVDGVMQTSHLTEEELLSVDKIGDTNWQYVRETDEWIPIFKYVGNPHNLPITHFVDVEDYAALPPHDHEKFWITPKGFKW